MSTMILEMAPTQWADLKDIDDVEPINDSDLECMAEVREVLKKHGKRERFGVALLHKHFGMDDDEVLVEETNKKARQLTITPVKREVVGETVPTIWMLMDGDKKAMALCKACCSKC